MSDRYKQITTLPVKILSALPLCLGRSLIKLLLVPRLFPQHKKILLKENVENLMKRFLACASHDCRKIAVRYIDFYVSKIIDDVMLMNWSVKKIQSILDKIVIVEGKENLIQALKTPGGIVFLGSHLGSIFLASLALIKICLDEPALDKHALAVSLEPQMARSPVIEKWIREVGQLYQAQIDVLPITGGSLKSVRTIMHALKESRIITSNIDVLKGGGDHTSYSLINNMKVYLPALTGALKCAIRSESALIPWFNFKTNDGKLFIKFEKPYLFSQNSFQQDGKFLNLEDLQQKLAELFSSYLLKYPEQWQYWDRLEKRLVC